MPDDQTAILVVDDDTAHRFMLSTMLGEWGFRVSEAEDGDTAVARVRERPFDAILMDVRMARMDGMTALGEINRLNPAIPVIIMTAYSTVDDAVLAMKRGAREYLTKPLDFERLRRILENAVEHRQLIAVESSANNPLPAFDATGIIGASLPMRTLLETMAYVAPSEATVLISGESGTGKELIAAALHRNSKRAGGPFVPVNCAALVETLLESELFGHERGAFTGADRRREGKFVQADGGTIFLDEIGETSPAMQAKLLRVLQEQEIQRVGGQEHQKVDVRVLAATNRNLAEEVRGGRFREDLYYRLNVVNLEVPPLRTRADDIPLLAGFFLEKFARKNHRVVAGITPACMDLLRRYPWPGNVRELENAIERGVILLRGDYLDEASLPLTIGKWVQEQSAPVAAAPEPATLEDAEIRMILRTLDETGGNKSEAARRLQITRKTLNSKLKKFDPAD
ncbi:MAG: sigma-54 dependent transcriptional regulator [Thermodesulfobacteriota bacterium]